MLDDRRVTQAESNRFPYQLARDPVRQSADWPDPARDPICLATPNRRRGREQTQRQYGCRE